MSQAAPGKADVWWLGQGSFVFEGPKSGPLVVDPFLSDSVEHGGGPKRLHPSPVAPADLCASGIFLTHDHTDHTDPETLPALCATNPEAAIYAVPESIAHLQRLGISGPNVHRIERGQTVYGDGWHAHAVHAEHTADSVGLVFVFDDGPCLYHTADTEYFEGIEAARAWGITLLTICINGRWGNMGIDDAVRVTTAIQPRFVLPMHWGLFAENTADPNEFAIKLAATGIPVETILLPSDGSARYTVSAGPP
jgi:L-ascorbate metabolism protein UlaG (beta-lactamase superfamily)